MYVNYIMNVDIINQFMLSLFFIYFLLISSDISTLLNCTTQRFLKDNHYMKHVILFASIFILTFILNWYSPDSIVVEKKSKEEEKEGFITLEGFKYGYLISSVLNSIFIYLIFLITTKIDANHFGIFVSLLIFVFIIFLIYKVNLSELNIKESPKGFFMTSNIIAESTSDENESIEIKSNEITNTVYLYNTLIISYIAIFGVLGHGLYKYYLTKRKNMGKNINIMNLLLDSHKCK